MMLEPNQIPKEYFKDCDRCSKVYGSFGCCVTVSNEWVYDCIKGHKEHLDKAIHRLTQEEDDPHSDWL